MTARLATDASHLYKVVDTVRGKFYIGKHGGREQRGYWGSGTRIKRHIKKYGVQDMKYEILVIADDQYIMDLERMYVTDEFIKANSDCLNLCKGGMGGNLGGTPWNKGMVLPEISKMMSRIHKGNTYRRGIKHTPESIKKMRNAHQTRVRTPLSEKGREAISRVHLGIKQPTSQCPHCQKTGGYVAMIRWHFENCRLKENNYALDPVE
jgi:hypothetical protein